MRAIFLDSSPLSLLCKPTQTPEVIAVTRWAVSCLAAGHELYVPEVIDYEVRRELRRAGKTAGLAKLDGLQATFRYVPLTTGVMRLAADLWAQSRQRGRPTGDPKRLDIDVILAAQALTLALPAADLVIATSNVAHLTQFAPADLWTAITP